MPTMRTEQHHDALPTNRKARRAQGAAQPRFGGGRLVVANPRQYAMRRR
ncbi:hypothetical protein SUDANB95_05155 [Actinosynnema sp. ALI-1.44]|uniref:Uncharacterized protein n=1 Tax=Saccharothrix mutabilis subsp. mutabilis TaxID=66855 RepID=A0ABP3DVR5_9PSEU